MTFLRPHDQRSDRQPSTPTLTRLAKEYGFASNFYAIPHPSEPNYVALVAADDASGIVNMMPLFAVTPH